MSDDKLDLKLNVDVDVHDADKAKSLREELERIDAELRSIAKHTSESFRGLGNLAKSLGRVRPGAGSSAAGSRDAVDGERDLLAEMKRRWTFERRMASQRRGEENEAARAARDEAREVEARFHDQMRFNSAMHRQRERETRERESAERQEIIATAKIRDKAARDAIRQANEVRRAEERAQEQAKAQVARGAGRVRSGVGHAAVAGGATGLALAYGSKRGLDRLTRSGLDIDEAMAANARLESGLSPEEANKKVRAIRDKYKPLARRLGQTAAELMRTRSEALQAGVSDDIVDSVVADATRYALANGMKPSEVAESSGYGLTALSAYGKVDAARASRMFNLQQHLAQTTAASRQGLASFVKRGMSAGAMAGFSDADALAYGAAGTMAGQDGESVARMLASTQARLAEAPTKAADIARHKHKTLKDRLFLSLPRKLGFSSWKEIKDAFSQDAAGLTEKLYDAIGDVQDPRERLELSEMLWGKEFGAAHSGMAAGKFFSKTRKAVRDPEAGTALDRAMAIQDTSFPQIMAQINATVTELLNDLGLELKPLWSDIRDWILKSPKAFESFTTAFRAGLSGFLSGLGSPNGTMAGLLNRWMGDPSSFVINARAVGDFARGVGQGLRDIGSAIVSFVRVFAGSNASPEEMGRWTARILGLSAALLVAAPAVAILGGLATAISGFCTVILSTYGLMKAAGFVGGSSTAPKLPGGPAAAASGGWMAMFSRLFPAFAMPLTTDASKADQDALMKRLGAFALEIEKNKRAVEEQKQAVEGNTEALQDGARIQRQSFEGNGFGGLIHKASITSAAASIGDSIRSTAARAASPLSGTVGSGGGAALAGSTPGGALPGTGLGYKGIIGGSAGNDNASPDQKSGGSRSWRNNNPGNLEYGPFAKANGAIGSDGRFAKFATYEAGRKAQEKLLFESESYKNLTLAQAIRRYAPAHENDVGAYIKATGANPSMRMADFSPSQRAALQDAMQRHEGWKTGTVTGGGGTGGNGGSGGNPVDVAKNFIGMGEHNSGRAALEKFTGGNIVGAASAWCARFVNASLAAVGEKGTGSAVANSFLRWGQGISAEMVQKGDVLVRHNGRGAGATGGHVGMATGNRRMGRDGQLELEMISGNSSDRVQTTWEKASRIAARRGAEYREKAESVANAAKADSEGWQDIADGMRRTPWVKKPASSGENRIDDLVRRPSQGTGSDITAEMPFRKLGTDAPIRTAPVPMSGRGGGAGGPAVNVTQHIHGAGHSPEELANTVNRRLNDEMRRRSHDVDVGWG